MAPPYLLNGGRGVPEMMRTLVGNVTKILKRAQGRGEDLRLAAPGQAARSEEPKKTTEKKL